MLDAFIKPSGGSRRDLFRALGIVALGGAAATVLDACSGGGSAGATRSASTSAEVVPKSAVPQGSGVVRGGFVITQPTAGRFKAFSNICTHQGCPINQVNGNKITCNCHGSEFSIADGSVLRGPAVQPLPKMKISVDGSNLDVSA